MKLNIKMFTLLLVLTTSCVVLPRQTEAKHSSISFQIFYDELSSYGQWIDYANYGYVWIPDAASDFVPYSSQGHWIMTNYGWSWASDYNWGWAAFHYGRWGFTDSFGWVWVPDNEWGPAWVNWRQAEGYYGWSPMEPGVTISMSFANRYDSNNDHWMFVRNRDFDRPNINQYYVNRSNHEQIIRNSRIINNIYNDNSRQTTYVTGPSRKDIESSTGRKIVPLTVLNNNRPGKELNNGRLQIYRPQIEKNNNERRATPTRVTNQNDVKRKSVNQNQGTMEERRTNSVIPNNTNRETIPAQNTNQQKRITSPSNERKIETVEPTTSAPVNSVITKKRADVVVPKQVQQRDNTKQKGTVQQRITSPAKTQSKSQSTHQQRVYPSTNNRPVEEQKSIKQKIQKVQERIPDKVTNPNQ